MTAAATMGAVVLLAFASGTAAAESTTPAPRSGLVVAVGLGAGRLGCSDSDGNDCTRSGDAEAGTFVAEVGSMLRPTLALVGHLQVAVHRDDDVTVSQTILAAAVRGWAAPRLWLEGGLGIAQARLDVDGGVVDYTSQSDTVPAIVGGVGFEIISTDRLALDVNLRAATGLYRDDVRLYQTSLGVGVSFF